MAYYNKILQSNLGKSLINYKILSGKYIIYETNTRAKIYNAYNDEIIYEGEYLNGRKNGKGKEYYDNSVLKFEGGYLNNKRNGKGKEYYDNGVLKFEGEYLNGKRNGKGKEYYHDGNLKFEVEYINGKIWNIKEYDEDKNIKNELHAGKGL